MGADPTFTPNRVRPGITRAGAHNGGALDMSQTHSELGDVARTSPRSSKSHTYVESPIADPLGCITRAAITTAEVKPRAFLGRDVTVFLTCQAPDR